MGLSISHIQPLEPYNCFNRNQWQPCSNEDEDMFNQFGEYTIWNNIADPTQSICQYFLSFNSKKDYDFYYDCFLWRLNEPEISKTKYFVSQLNRHLCSTFYQATVYIDNPKFRLSDFKDIPFPDNLYCLNSMLLGYQKIYDNINTVFPTVEQQVCIDKFGNITVWLNRDLSKNYPQQYDLEPMFDNIIQGQSEIVKSIIKMVVINTDVATEPNPTFQSYLQRYIQEDAKEDNLLNPNQYLTNIQKNKSNHGSALNSHRNRQIITFEQALNIVENYANRYSEEGIPENFRSVLTISNSQRQVFQSSIRSRIELSENHSQNHMLKINDKNSNFSSSNFLKENPSQSWTFNLPNHKQSRQFLHNSSMLFHQQDHRQGSTSQIMVNKTKPTKQISVNILRQYTHSQQPKPFQQKPYVVHHQMPHISKNNQDQSVMHQLSPVPSISPNLLYAVPTVYTLQNKTSTNSDSRSMKNDSDSLTSNFRRGYQMSNFQNRVSNHNHSLSVPKNPVMKPEAPIPYSYRNYQNYISETVSYQHLNYSQNTISSRQRMEETYQKLDGYQDQTTFASKIYKKNPTSIMHRQTAEIQRRKLYEIDENVYGENQLEGSNGRDLGSRFMRFGLDSQMDELDPQIVEDLQMYKSRLSEL